jgi:DivIVA domain-containing protein
MNHRSPALRSATGPMSPRAVREASFTHRRKGLDEDEVRGFLAALADRLAVADAERARLRAENEDLRNRLEATQDAEQIVHPRAIALFSQAQQVADNLVAEAVEHARTMMQDARRQQREMLDTARSNARPAAEPGPLGETTTVLDGQHPPGHAASGEVEYVRTFARVAQVQLRSVLDALTEQVNRLGDVSQPEQPDHPDGPDSPDGPDRSGPVQWRVVRGSAG